MRAFLIVLACLLAIACGSDSSDGRASSVAASDEDRSETTGFATRAERLQQQMGDPEAARVFAGVLETIAPDRGWERTRYVAFDRYSSSGTLRSHRWDRWEGTYWIRAPVGENEMVALFNVNAPTRDERIWLDGEAVVDEARSDSLATRAHAWFINDTYWLLFPFKWADPGVNTRYLGEMEQWGETWDVLELTFENVGLTPQNRYRAFVDPESGRFELWQHYTNVDDEEPRFTNRWADWQRYGPIFLSSRRESQDGSLGVHFENLTASTEVPAGAFDPP